MTTLEDAHDVLSALRLGWAVAEFRGRNRPALQSALDLLEADNLAEHRNWWRQPDEQRKCCA